MHTSTQGTMDSVPEASSHRIQRSIDQQDFDTPGSEVLELTPMLQTTLDVDQQIQLFAKAIQSYLNVDGVKYLNNEAAVSSLIGNEATHQVTYDLKLESSPLGSLRFFRELPFANSELQKLENLLCALVYPLRNALTYLEALRLASHDPLTGIQNRLALQQASEREVDLASRQNAPLSLLLIDADHFKQFNDKFGHAFGDDVLRSLAQTTSATIRRSDLLFRYGGEEFVVLASHTNSEGAKLLSERIREAVAGITTIRGRKVTLSVSIGIAQLAAGESADSLFLRADNAMYQAKSNGRNRVEVAD